MNLLNVVQLLFSFCLLSCHSSNKRREKREVSQHCQNPENYQPQFVGGLYISKMTEQSRVGDVHVPDVPRPKLELQHLTVTKKDTTTSQPSSPVALSKGPGVKYNCLCSPTTHAGSFRCRHHRNMSRNSRSVGSKLNELAGDT